MYEYSKANIKNVQNIIRRNTKLQFNEFFKSFGKLIRRMQVMSELHKFFSILSHSSLLQH